MAETSGQRTVIHTAFVPDDIKPVNKKSRTVRPRSFAGHVKGLRKKLTFSERLLKNTAISCALLLGILAVRNIDAPWSKAAVNGIESALTMRFDPDGSFGEVDFLKNIMPESSLVFFNISGSRPAQVVSGYVDHSFTDSQPWTTYSCADDAEVRCAMAGTVSAVTELSEGDWCVLVDHGDGMETVYAFMERPEVNSGDSVARGGRLGVVRGETLYYEMRRDGSSVEPEGGSNVEPGGDR